MKVTESLDAVVPKEYLQFYRGFEPKHPEGQGLPDGAHMFQFPRTQGGDGILRAFLAEVGGRSLLGQTVALDIGDKGQFAPEWKPVY